MDILVVYKKSKYELYKDHPESEVQSYLKEGSDHVAGMVQAHQYQKECLEEVLKTIESHKLSYQLLYRSELQHIENKDLIVVVGGDGTFLEVSRFVEDVPMLGVNSDPARSTGYMSSVSKGEFNSYFNKLGSETITVVSRLKLSINNVPYCYALNDIFFTHKNPAATTRFKLHVHNQSESYKNSGLLVCTGMGSSAWMYQEGGEIFDFDADYFSYYLRGTRGATFNKAKNLEISSFTRSGMVFVDGPHKRIPLGLGDCMHIEMGPNLKIYGDLKSKRE